MRHGRARLGDASRAHTRTQSAAVSTLEPAAPGGTGGCVDIGALIHIRSQAPTVECVVRCDTDSISPPMIAWPGDAGT